MLFNGIKSFVKWIVLDRGNEEIQEENNITPICYHPD